MNIDRVDKNTTHSSESSEENFLCVGTAITRTGSGHYGRKVRRKFNERTGKNYISDTVTSHPRISTFYEFIYSVTVPAII